MQSSFFRPAAFSRSGPFSPKTGNPFSSAEHCLIEGDSRNLSPIRDESVHLVVTSPPYGDLKKYPEHPGQLGNLPDYDAFLDQLDRIWAECFRVLVPGGRVCCVVGDICLSRRQAGRHHILPLPADIQVRARKIGFDNLTPIRWFKVANIRLEGSRSRRFLGRPNSPNGIIKNDLEQILFLRKPGGYRNPTSAQERASRIDTDSYVKWFAPIWRDVGGEKRNLHPAPYPLEIPRRLIRMFSFVGDTVLDPFAGTGTTALAAMEAGRRSISFEVEPKYIGQIKKRFEKRKIFSKINDNSCVSVNSFKNQSVHGELASASYVSLLVRGAKIQTS